MSTPAVAVRPLPVAPRRLQGIDVARGLALVGMMGAHLLPSLDAAGRVTPWFWVAAGRSAALFVLLAGVGLALATGGEHPRLRPWRVTAAGLVVRALLVATLGLLLVELNPPVAVILTNYGLLFVLALPLLALRPRALLALAAIWVVVVPLLSHAMRTRLPPGPGEQPSFGDLWGTPLDLLSRLVLTGYYPVLTFVAYLMVGLAVGRMPLRRPGVAARLAGAGAAVAGGAWGMSALAVSAGWPALVQAGPATVVVPGLGQAQLLLRGQYGTSPTTTWWWQSVVSPHTGTPFDLAQTIGSALLVLGLVLLLVEWLDRRPAALRPVLRPLHGLVTAVGYAGSMTLTIYSLHVVAATGQQAVPWRAGLLGAHVGTALLLSVLWRRHAPRGPFEAMVHAASYRARQGVASRSR